MRSPLVRSPGVGLGLLLAVSLAAGPAPPDDKPVDKTADLVGTWQWEWKDGEGNTHRHVLEVESAGAKVVARERFDDEEPVKVNDLKSDGKKVYFTVLRGDRRAAYSGKLAEKDTINGTVEVSGANNQPNEYAWTAARKPVEKK